MIDNPRGLTNLLNSTDKTVFTTNDFNKFWKYDNYPSLIQRLNYLKKTHKINKIKKGFYSIKGRKINKFELANKLRTPSYISFETVLYQNNVIFQWNNNITLAGQESIKLEVLEFEIIFRQIKDSILLDNSGIVNKDNYYIASLERAVLDTLYINPKFSFDNLRPIDFPKLEKFAPIYNKKSILKIIKELKNNA